MATLGRGRVTLDLVTKTVILSGLSYTHKSTVVPRGPAIPRTVRQRGTLRRLRQQHGSGADASALPALPAAGHRVDGGLAPDFRWRGTWLGRGTHDAGRGRGTAGIRRALRRS